MKKLFAIALVFLLAAVFACDSPTEIDANRKKTVTTEKETEGPKFEFSRNFVDMGQAEYFKTSSATLSLRNLTNQDLVLNGAEFVCEDPKFQVNSDYFPLWLEPAGFEGDEQKIFVTFFAESFGVFTDTLVFDGNDSITVAFKATVPTVFVGDLNFGGVRVGEDKTYSSSITNYSNAAIFVRSFKLVDTDGVFEVDRLEDSTYVPAGKSSGFTVKFTPKDPMRRYKGRVELSVVASKGPVDAVSLLEGFSGE